MGKLLHMDTEARLSTRRKSVRVGWVWEEREDEGAWKGKGEGEEGIPCKSAS